MSKKKGARPVFDVVYVGAYAFFMFVYKCMTTRPSVAYMLGVLLYLAGYAVLAVPSYNAACPMIQTLQGGMSNLTRPHVPSYKGAMTRVTRRHAISYKAACFYVPMFPCSSVSRYIVFAVLTISQHADVTFKGSLHSITAFILMAHIVMAYIVMAYVAMAYVVMTCK